MCGSQPGNSGGAKILKKKPKNSACYLLTSSGNYAVFG